MITSKSPQKRHGSTNKKSQEHPDFERNLIWRTNTLDRYNSASVHQCRKETDENYKRKKTCIKISNPMYLDT